MISDKRSKSEKFEISKIEEELKLAFNPIKPDPYFVSKLKKRLSQRANVSIEAHPEYFVIMLVGVGLIFGLGLYWLLVRFYNKAKGN
ncbi:MAG TPA: hypothetical protein G4N92_02750 [Anaerolineae bacterium]|nr:hypothetical protein [Anaerolineae bacterium]